MLKILSLDTSTEMCSVALLQGSEILARQQLALHKHAELVLPLVDELLAEAGLSLNQLDALAFGQGPGSFMGLRIGVGVIQGLAYGADKPVIPISSLQTLAQTAYQQNGFDQVLVAFDARMQALYWGVYELDANWLMQALQPDALAKPAEVKFSSAQQFKAVGAAWGIYAPELNWDIEKPVELYPLASAMLPIAAFQYQQQRYLTAFEAEPSYLRDQVTH